MKHQERYISALVKELQLRKTELADEIVESIYFGGGTPSQLAPALFVPLFDVIAAHYTCSDSMEITLEANPDDLITDYLAAIASLPFNRISMGVQSFVERDLHFLNRRHSAAQAIEAVERVRVFGFENISIDLIYGLPNQTLAEWQANVAQAIALDVPHLSAYHLIYEEGTALYRLREQGSVRECDEVTSLALFEHLITALKEAGYDHYEISNFAKPQRYARHNSAYWQNKPYLGVGAAAHSYTQGVRRSNVPHLMEYMEGVEGQLSTYFEKEFLTKEEEYNDLVITSLRTMWGLNLEEVAERFGSERCTYCLEMAAPYLVEGTLLREDNVLRITEEGVFVSDGIMSALLFVD